MRRPLVAAERDHVTGETRISFTLDGLGHGVILGSIWEIGPVDPLSDEPSEDPTPGLLLREAVADFLSEWTHGDRTRTLVDLRADLEAAAREFDRTTS